MTLVGLILYVGFLVATLFADTNAGISTGEVEPIMIKAKADSLNVEYGNFSEPCRPPVYIGIGPGGPPNQIIPLKTGIISREGK